MKYKHCPDCGAPMAFKKSSDNWASDHDCSTCGLNIHTSFGETMHAAPDKEKWTRKAIPGALMPWVIFLNLWRQAGTSPGNYEYFLRKKA